MQAFRTLLQSLMWSNRPSATPLCWQAVLPAAGQLPGCCGTAALLAVPVLLVMLQSVWQHSSPNTSTHACMHMCKYSRCVSVCTAVHLSTCLSACLWTCTGCMCAGDRMLKRYCDRAHDAELSVQDCDRFAQHSIPSAQAGDSLVDSVTAVLYLFHHRKQTRLPAPAVTLATQCLVA